MPNLKTGRLAGRAMVRRALIRSARYLALSFFPTHRRASLWLAVVSALAVGLAPAAAADLRGLVDQAAAAAGVPAAIAHAVIAQESGYRPGLRGAAGEWGIGQIKCQTAREVGLRGSCGQLADAATNLKFSMAYLRLALDRGGRGCAGVALYQRGLGGSRSCSRYGRAVIARTTLR